jgi:hypothetical protein
VLAVLEVPIRWLGGELGCGVLGEKEREGGIYRQQQHGQGTRVRARGRDRTAAGVSVFGADFSAG